MTGGHAAWLGEKEKTKKYGNKSEVGPWKNGNPDEWYTAGHDDKARRSKGRRAQRGDSTSEDEARHREDVAAR